MTFAPLTPGKYRVTIWHPFLLGRSQVVEVQHGKMAKVTF